MKDVLIRGRKDSGLELNLLAVVWDHPRVSSLRVVINPRLRSTLARWEPPGDVIQVSPAATERGGRALREIVWHEVAHVVVWDRYGNTVKPHGSEWMELMRAAGIEPRAILIRCGQEYRRKSSGLRYRHFCPVCQFSHIAKRRVVKWRCPECRAIGLPGRLQVEAVPTI